MSLLVDIEKKLGNFWLKVFLEAENETLALLGASGCGKSMTLKCIAGVEKPDRGQIVLDGVPLFDSRRKINLSVQERRTGLVFQNYALFPNMTVQQNVEAGARREKDAKKRKKMIQEYVESFGLAGEWKKYPSELSGGQQQRVALARALVSAPNILLLDEPFSALDSHLRFQLEREVQGAIHSFGKTVLLVTHNRDEAYRMADKVAVMNNGQIERIGKKEEVFASPETKNSAILTGCKNISRAKKIDDTHLLAVDWGIELCVPKIPEDVEYVGIRMHHIREGHGENQLHCFVEEIIENPFSYTLLLRKQQGKGKTFGWEVDKTFWNYYHGKRSSQGKEDTVEIAQKMEKGQMVDIWIPSEAILLLKG